MLCPDAAKSVRQFISRAEIVLGVPDANTVREEIHAPAHWGVLSPHGLSQRDFELLPRLLLVRKDRPDALLGA
jgi:hypothetical protein